MHLRTEVSNVEEAVVRREAQYWTVVGDVDVGTQVTLAVANRTKDTGSSFTVHGPPAAKSTGGRRRSRRRTTGKQISWMVTDGDRD